MILLNQGYTKDADPLSPTWCKTSDYFGARKQTISSQIWRRIMRKHGAKWLPTFQSSIEPAIHVQLCKGLKIFPEEMGYPRVMACWYSPFWDPGTTKGPGFKPSDVKVKHLLALWQWASLDLGLSTACQVGCASKNKSKKGFGLSMLKACSNMSKVKGCFLGGWNFSMLEDHVMYRSLVW
jgi:hypothetical protein